MIVEITRAEYAKAKPPRGAPITQERRWFKDGEHYAVILLDHDGEWTFVVLAPCPDRSETNIAGVAIGPFLKTEAEAIKQAKEVLAHHVSKGTITEGPAVTQAEAVSILAKVTGKSEAYIEAGMAAALVPQSRNN